MSDVVKPRVRVSARSEPLSTDKAFIADGFKNFSAQLGYGTNNIGSGGTYGFNPISRNRTMLEWAYRGAWLVRQVVDAVADDMTRMGTIIESKMPPDRIVKLDKFWNDWQINMRINEAIRWSRLYGGAIAYIMVDGQEASQPLRLSTVKRGQFKGLYVFDRWMAQPSLDETVDELGVDFGKPKYYRIVEDARMARGLKIHHSRVIRLEGNPIPYYQRNSEMGWGISVIESMWDRLLAFDSATQGAAQLVYRAHLRVLQVKDLRELIVASGPAYGAFLQYVQLMRTMQTNEGITVLDAEDQFQAHQYAFSGLSDMLVQFSQQVSGAAQVPLTRLFGQSPAGMNATGESDMRNYYDFIRAQQESKLTGGYFKLYHLTHRSLFEEDLPDDFGFSFTPLWQMTTGEKVSVAAQVSTTMDQLFTSNMVGRKTALQELRQMSRETGMFTNITDEMIEDADNDPPPMMGEGMGGMPGGPVMSGAPTDEAPDASAIMQEPLDPHLAQQQGVEYDGNVEEPIDERGMQAIGIIAEGEKQRMAEKVIALLTRDAKLRDGRAMIDFHGLDIVIETPKGSKRLGYGWAVNMPADYGYISGTSSAEGINEQMDVFVGPEDDSQLVWIIDQVDPNNKQFNEHKCMLGYLDKESALADYKAAFNDGSGAERIGTVRRMHIDVFKRWLSHNWRPNALNGR